MRAFLITVVAALCLCLTCFAQVQLSGSFTGNTVWSSPGSVQTFPSSATVEQTAVVPFSCTNGTSNTCTWSLVSGIGSVTSSGVYTAPASSGSALIRATLSSATKDVPITVSGTIPAATGDCASSYPNRGVGTFNSCNMNHQEVSAIVSRHWLTVIPTNYVAGQSGLIVLFGGGGHGVSPGQTGQPCGPPQGEVGGWAPYIHTVPSPAPVVVCPEGMFNTANTTEKWDFVGITTGSFGWLAGTEPNDPDFVRQLVLLTVRDLQLNAIKVYVATEWPSGSFTSPMGIQFAAGNADLIAAIATYNDSQMFGMTYNAATATYTVATTAQQHIGSTLSPPTEPISVILEPGITTAAHGGVQDMCGTNLDITNGTLYHPDTIDTTMNYWDFTDQVTGHSYQPNNVGASFCSGTYDSSNNGLPSSLQVRKDTGGLLGTEVYAYRFKANATGTPWCSFNWSGGDTLGCNNPGLSSKIALDLRNSTCDFTTPCNAFMDAGTGPASASGYDPLGIFYKFFLSHSKP